MEGTFPNHGRSLVDDELLIRTAIHAYAGDIGRIHLRSRQLAYQTILPGDDLPSSSIEKWVRRWEQNLAGPSSVETLVAQYDRTIVGFASTGPSRDPDAVSGVTAEVWALYVDPEHWGQAIGWRLWNRARSRLREQGYLDVTLWAIEGNARARRFYERQGFSLEPGRLQRIELLNTMVPQVRYRSGLRP